MLQTAFSLFPSIEGALTSSAAQAMFATGVVLVSAVTLLLAFCHDRYWGEPASRFHPVVWMGSYLQRAGDLNVRLKPVVAFVCGAFFWCLGAACCAAVAWWLQMLAIDLIAWWSLALAGFLQNDQAALAQTGLEWASKAMGLLVLLAVMAGLLKCMFSWRMLTSEVRAVENALAQSLTAGRERLSWLVSRDTSALTASEVRESAIESLAENLNDSVVAPVFWFVLFGLPGAVVYRFANTADAMWGYPGVYRDKNWQWAGKWAARADDVLSWLPARLTAWLIARAAHGQGIVNLRREARKTPSPNSGWPMAAMALALGVRLCKPGVYALNESGRLPGPDHTIRAQMLAAGAVRRLIAGVLAVWLVCGAWTGVRAFGLIRAAAQAPAVTPLPAAAKAVPAKIRE